MIRSIWKCLLCLCVAPILHGQGIAPNANQGAPRTTNQSLPNAVNSPSLTVPRGTLVVLVATDSFSSDEVKPGTSAQFVVARDVMIGQTVIIPAGREVKGVITTTKLSRSATKPGHLTVRIEPIPIGINRLHLVSSNPDPRGALQKTKDAAIATGQCIIYLPFCLLIESISHGDSRASGNGPAILRACFPIEFWTNSAATVTSPGISLATPSPLISISDICPDLKLPSQDSLLPAYLPDVKFK